MPVDEAVAITNDEWAKADRGRDARQKRDAHDQAVQSEQDYQSVARKARLALNAAKTWHNLFLTQGNTEEARADFRDRTAIIDTIQGAVASNYWEQLNDANAVIPLIQEVPENTRREWNESNVINQLAGFSDIKLLREALEKLVRDGISARLTGDVEATMK